ncbi:hypothetical protein FVF58_10330 [Paraburkholderia panacisoli]|uniref:Uncharacterized protein n=1 Tax=Paraburkholderia panacisoli TaxID=2603818 RepID=A0A5B0HDI8_9BURK|nr:hypothetical protein [Paraburkholderia panacisoli]KAA1013162.1 hypothetical protein FVF58_10330 [Paraburkholderia panacisoli]
MSWLRRPTGAAQAMDDSAHPIPSPEPQRETVRPTVDLATIVLAVATLVLLIGGSLDIVHPFVPALIWGSTIVVTTWSLMLGVQRRLAGRRWLAVTVMLLLEIVVICIPTYAAVSMLAGHAADIMNFVERLADDALPSPRAGCAACR